MSAPPSFGDAPHDSEPDPATVETSVEPLSATADAPADTVVSPSGRPAVAGMIGAGESDRASRFWWDSDAEDYHRRHGGFLGTDRPDGDFVWCPEGLREADLGLLGPIEGRDILEVGCGSALCARWLAANGAGRVVGIDISAGMLGRAAAAIAASPGPQPYLVQASAQRLPLAANSFDAACSAFGAVPFVADTAGVMAEVARVLRPGGRWVFSVNHPFRWAFLDDPGPEGLIATLSYFDRTPYTEYEDGRLTYVEHHRTVGDRIRDIVSAGLVLDDLIEPEWPEDGETSWEQWSPLRGQLLPATAIFVCHKP